MTQPAAISVVPDATRITDQAPRKVHPDRLLALIRAGDPDGAAAEIERHLRVLSFMGRLAGPAPTARRPPGSDVTGLSPR
jgi:hypothetical protein